MADASSVRTVNGSELPAATGRTASSIRYFKKKLWYADGTNWNQLQTQRPNVISLPIFVSGVAATGIIYTADRPLQVVSITEMHGTAEKTATTLTLTVTKDTGTTAAGGGTALLKTALDVVGVAANTVQTGTLTTTSSALVLAPGDRLGVKLSASATELANVTLEIGLQMADPRLEITAPLTAPTTAALETQTFFVADRAYQVTAATAVWGTAEATAATLTLDLLKETGTTAPGSGNSITTGATSTKATANTVVNYTTSATPSYLVLAPGDRLSAKFSAASTELANVVVTVVLQAIVDQPVAASVKAANLADATSKTFFVADQPYRIASINEIHSTASSVATAYILVTKESGTTAAGSGVAVITGNSVAGTAGTTVGFDSHGTANTVQNGTLNTVSDGVLDLAPGDRLSVSFVGTQTALVGAAVSVALLPW